MDFPQECDLTRDKVVKINQREALHNVAQKHTFVTLLHVYAVKSVLMLQFWYRIDSDISMLMVLLILLILI